MDTPDKKKHERKQKSQNKNELLNKNFVDIETQFRNLTQPQNKNIEIFEVYSTKLLNQ